MWRGSVVPASALALGLLQIHPAAQAAKQSTAKVETLVVGPSEPGIDLYVSPHGGHVAAVTLRGSRSAITYDGVVGPPLDEIVGKPQERVSYSPDNQRYAYIGRSGQEYIVFVDGKELQRFPVATTHWEPGMNALPGVITSVPHFTPNSKHVFLFAIAEHDGKQQRQLFFDGQLVAAPYPNVRNLVLSHDGEHYAYVAAVNADERVGGGYEDKEFALIVDGKPAGYQGLNPQFSADGKHLFTRIRTRNAATGGQDVVILLDGKSYVRAEDAILYIPPAGYRMVTVVTSSRQGGVPTKFLVVDGKRVPGTDADAISQVVFSPDGKHWAAACTLPQTKGQFMVIDGKKGAEYSPGFASLPRPTLTAMGFAPAEVAPSILFSADSTRSAYLGLSGGKTFAVIDGVEFETGYASIGALAFGGGGKRLGFIGLTDARSRWVVVDGKAAQSNFAQVDDFAFSPDGSHYAYTADGAATGQQLSTRRLFVDGVSDEGIVLSAMPRVGLLDTRPITFLFSPDGRHLALHGSSNSAARKTGMFIDGKYMTESSNRGVSSPTFTPDSQHFFGFDQVNDPTGSRVAIVIFVDGRVAAKIDGNVSTNRFLEQAGAWDMSPDGVLTAIAAVGPNLVRFRITPPADTSIDTLLASGSK